MVTVDQWLLPDGVEDVLPAKAAQLESLRRKLLDLYKSWGYELILPPMIEFLESLLSGASSDLDLQTFKVTDQLSGRLMGVRADITPQAARIDAHSLHYQGPARLCYAGTVLNTKPSGLAASRIPFQTGVELFGHKGAGSDTEVLSLMVATLTAAGAENVHVDLGHVGVFRSLVQAAELDEAQQQQLLDIYQRKDESGLQAFVGEFIKDQDLAEMLLGLVTLSGDESVLTKAKSVLAKANADVQSALTNLIAIAEGVKQSCPDVVLYFDLSELHGYLYHTGCVFAAYLPGCTQAVAKGGRYDAVGQAFGRTRPATGFSCDLKQLVSLIPAVKKHIDGILVPVALAETAEGRAEITRLRAAGERVVTELAGQAIVTEELACDRQLELVDGQFTHIPLT